MFYVIVIEQSYLSCRLLHCRDRGIRRHGECDTIRYRRDRKKSRVGRRGKKSWSRCERGRQASCRRCFAPALLEHFCSPEHLGFPEHHCFTTKCFLTGNHSFITKCLFVSNHSRTRNFALAQHGIGGIFIVQPLVAPNAETRASSVLMKTPYAAQFLCSLDRHSGTNRRLWSKAGIAARRKWAGGRELKAFDVGGEGRIRLMRFCFR